MSALFFAMYYHFGLIQEMLEGKGQQHPDPDVNGSPEIIPAPLKHTTLTFRTILFRTLTSKALGLISFDEMGNIVVTADHHNRQQRLYTLSHSIDAMQEAMAEYWEKLETTITTIGGIIHSMDELHLYNSYFLGLNPEDLGILAELEKRLSALKEKLSGSSALNDEEFEKLEKEADECLVHLSQIEIHIPDVEGVETETSAPTSAT